MRLVIKNARAGRLVGGKFKAGLGRRRTAKRSTRNIKAGFYDEEGIFHPIRASADYDGRRAGDRRPKARKAKKRNPPRRRPVARRKKKNTGRNRLGQFKKGHR
jgi:hypothetical protein